MILVDLEVTAFVCFLHFLEHSFGFFKCLFLLLHCYFRLVLLLQLHLLYVFRKPLIYNTCQLCVYYYYYCYNRFTTLCCQLCVLSAELLDVQQ